MGPNGFPAMHLVHLIARLNDGGPARVVAELASGAQAAGHRVTILSGQVGADERDLGPELAAAGLTIVTIPGLRRAPGAVDELRAFAAVLARLRALQPDLVHTHTAKAGALGRLACRLLGLPCLHSYHGHVLHGYFRPGINLLLRRVERGLAAAARLHTLTPSLVHELRDRHRLGHPWRWHCLPVPVAPVRPVAAPWHAALAGDRPVIGFLGRLAAVKDLTLWLHVLAVLQRQRPVQGLVCGDGEQRQHGQALAARLGLQVHFSGTVPAGEALAAMDLLLMSSRNEGLPLVAVEAAGAGVPVVAPLVGGLVDLARDGLVVGC